MGAWILSSSGRDVLSKGYREEEEQFGFFDLCSEGIQWTMMVGSMISGIRSIYTSILSQLLKKARGTIIRKTPVVTERLKQFIPAQAVASSDSQNVKCFTV